MACKDDRSDKTKVSLTSAALETLFNSSFTQEENTGFQVVPSQVRDL